MVGSSYKSIKVTPTFALDNKNCCEIELRFNSSTGNAYSFTAKYSSKDHSYKKEYIVEAESKGASSLKILNIVMQDFAARQIKYTSVTIYLDSDYGVKVFHTLGNLIASGKVKKSPNKDAIIKMFNIKEAVCSNYYVTVKKQKIIQLGRKLYHE
jgi:hypothetical protein